MAAGLGDRLTVGQVPLTHSVQVRILVAQPPSPSPRIPARPNRIRRTLFAGVIREALRFRGATAAEAQGNTRGGETNTAREQYRTKFQDAQRFRTTFAA